MDNLFDILQQAQNGQAIANLAEQFQLSQQQAKAAVEALLPAFSMGLKHQVEKAKAEPEEAPAQSAFFGLPDVTQQVEAFQNAATAFSQQATQQGTQVLSTLFGQGDMTRALAQQAALQSGVAAPVLAAMMPTLATILIGGLARAAQPQPANPMADLMGSMMQAFQPKPVPPPTPDGGLLAAMWAPFLETTKPPEPEPADPFARLLDAGTQMHKAQTEAMQSLFETWTGKK